jgi:hypothetical protein
MGRHRWTSRFTVEECLPLDVESVRDAGVLGSALGSVCTSSWISGSGEGLGSIECSVVRNQPDCLAVHIRRQYARLESVLRLVDECMIPIATTRPHLGGRRFWFRCPVVRDGKPCGKLAGRLYLPPEEQVFACRICHNLTYKSAQQHDQRKYDLARNPTALGAVLQSKNLRQASLGIGGLVLLGKWCFQGRARQLAKVSGLMPKWTG